MQNVEDKPWENEELKKSEEALPRLKEFWIVQSKKKERDATDSTRKFLWT